MQLPAFLSAWHRKEAKNAWWLVIFPTRNDFKELKMLTLSLRDFKQRILLTFFSTYGYPGKITNTTRYCKLWLQNVSTLHSKARKACVFSTQNIPQKYGGKFRANVKFGNMEKRLHCNA
ncbi:MAG: hypothetical protein C0594_00220 [Marinilabiliales bacterium]|nr:MAG: hypothetical protein C0594_00220 [Marinilabiliales bacterium]